MVRGIPNLFIWTINVLDYGRTEENNMYKEYFNKVVNEAKVFIMEDKWRTTSIALFLMLLASNYDRVPV